MGQKSMNPTACFCLRTRKASATVMRFCDNMLAPCGVIERQYSLLLNISQAESCSVRELADMTDLDRSTLARSLKPLHHEAKSDYIDMMEITSGLTIDGGESSYTPVIRNETEEGSILTGAMEVAIAVKIPVSSVAGHRTPDVIDKALTETPVTAIGLCRPLIREASLPNRWKTDRTKATYISCNRCVKSSGIIACQVKK